MLKSFKSLFLDSLIAVHIQQCVYLILNFNHAIWSLEYFVLETMGSYTNRDTQSHTRTHAHKSLVHYFTPKEITIFLWNPFKL